ncbi:MAG: RNA polymerase sigma factor [Actinomycetota bacterium]
MAEDQLRDPHTPEDLLTQCQLGDLESFLPLIKPHLQGIRLTVHSILHLKQDQEEVVQETILNAFANIGQLREANRLKPWLLQIAINASRQRLRRHRQELFEPIEHRPDADKEFMPRQYLDWRNIPSQELEQKEIRQALTTALDSLASGYRQVFVLRDVEHLSARETGELLGLTEAAVNTRLRRARLQMRELLAPLFRQETTKWRPVSVKMLKLIGRKILRNTISCRRAIRIIATCLGSNLAPDLRIQIEQHVRVCDRCAAILDSTQKMLYIVADDHVFDFPFYCDENWNELLRREFGKARSNRAGTC